MPRLPGTTTEHQRRLQIARSQESERRLNRQHKAALKRLEGVDDPAQRAVIVKQESVESQPEPRGINAKRARTRPVGSIVRGKRAKEPREGEPGKSSAEELDEVETKSHPDTCDGSSGWYWSAWKGLHREAKTKEVAKEYPRNGLRERIQADPRTGAEDLAGST